jgi:hypothetical protein
MVDSFLSYSQWDKMTVIYFIDIPLIFVGSVEADQVVSSGEI